MLRPCDVLFEYKNNNLYTHISKDAEPAIHIRLRIIKKFFHEALTCSSINNFSFILNLSDLCYDDNIYQMPYLCLTKKKDHEHILIPSIDFFSGLIFSVLNQSNNDTAFNDKDDKSIFVGSPTNMLRFKYCELTHGQDKHLAFITNVNKSDLDINPLMHRHIISPIQICDQLKNKIVVNIDGNTVCWSRLYWQMNSNSIPVYICKNKQYEQYFDRFNDDGCYFNADLDNYVDVYNYILDENNRSQVDMINNNGKMYCQNIFGDYMNNPKMYLLKTIRSAIEKVYNE